ncbi:MAG TPA: DUF2961 domain-containing protein, partial [Candidatus Hydrogenedentes bacterium]|nr:DUF2961 domain-containing protein [Candidatus Hydrogenedentota bacterium]
MMRAQHGMVLVGLMLVSAFGAQAGVTVESLWNEMTDLEGLTQFPAPAYVCKQFSSYDRRSTDPEVKTDENWFANGDRGQHLRVEERNGAEEWVLMDADGPGAIVRFWSANPSDAGIVRVYIDGVEEPVLELPLTSMLGGGGMPFVKPISGERSRGWNSYLPIPYARHCKVTTSKRDFYYQVNCRTYEPGTQVESFSLETASAHEELIERIAARLARPGHFRMPPDAKTVHLDADLAPGKEGVVDVGEPGAFYRATVHVEAEDMDAALRGCLLEITFDEAEEPAVLTPLGDFFGAAPGLNTYAALPCGVLADGTMYAHWVMPFARSAEVRVVNHSGRQVGVSVSLLVGAYAWTDRSMYFHAAWRGEYPLATQPRQDWTYVQVDGKGVYVGDMLHITNPVKQWWGEGDEKIYIDGEDFPSHFGTGTEDYYGYAWCCNEPFEHAYHNQPRCDGPGNYGQTSVNRFHIIDAIPFTTSFRFDMEVW